MKPTHSIYTLHLENQLPSIYQVVFQATTVALVLTTSLIENTLTQFVQLREFLFRHTQHTTHTRLQICTNSNSNIYTRKNVQINRKYENSFLNEANGKKIKYKRMFMSPHHYIFIYLQGTYRQIEKCRVGTMQFVSLSRNDRFCLFVGLQCIAYILCERKK